MAVKSRALAWAGAWATWAAGVTMTMPLPYAPARATTATVALMAPPQSLNPILDADAYGQEIDQLLYLPLLRPGTHGWVGALATSWSVSADGRTYAYVLRQGLRWSDGHPVTSEDVVATLRAFANPANGSPAAPQLALVQSVRAQGRWRVVVTLRRPWLPWQGVAATLPILPAHVLSQVRGERGLVQSPVLNTHPVTDGPYTVASFSRRTGTLTLVANPAYVGPPPAVDRLRFLVVPDPQVALQWLREGKVQVAPAPVSAWPRIKRLPGIQVYAPWTAGTLLVVLNVRDPVLRDPLTRVALNLAVDRAALVRTVLHGLGAPAAGPLPPVAVDAPHLAPWPYDPKRARQLLRQAGWRPGPGGVDVRGRQRLAFALAYTSTSPSMAQLVSLLAAELRRVGAQVTPVPLDFSSLQARAQAGDFDAVAQGWAMGPAPDLFSLLGGPQADPPHGWNEGAYADPAVTRLLARADQATSLAQARTLLAQAERQMRADPPYLFLTYGRTLVAVSRRLHGFGATPWSPDVGNPLTWTLSP
jgi:peptide/nickel transport system substrate-binding protein